MTLTVERVPADRTYPLRQHVLRPHETLGQLVLPGDDDPESGHFVAIEAGDVVGTASARREPPPWVRDAALAWRLRGMATAEGQRSRGIGSAVLDAALEHVREHGGGLVWCNARVPAVRFYERAGFVTRGESWVDLVIGPHIAMERTVAP